MPRISRSNPSGKKNTVDAKVPTRKKVREESQEDSPSSKGRKEPARGKQVLPSKPPSPPQSPATRSSVRKNTQMEVENVNLRSSQLAVGVVGKGSISTIAADEESGKESSGKASSTVTTKKTTIASTRSKRKAPPESIIEASGSPGIAESQGD